MKNIYFFKKITYIAVAILVMMGCQSDDKPPFGDYEIDPSILKINSPLDGSVVKVYEEPSSIDIEIQVDDDYLIDEISIVLDGNELAVLSEFDNPRHVLETYTFDGLVLGEHLLMVTSTDVNGVSTTVESNFSKEPPYSPLFDGEVLYMPFDGDFRDQVEGILAVEVGQPGFAGSGFSSSNAYKGATDSYLTFPSDELINDEFTATFWYKVSGDPDRSGILTVGDDATDRNQGFRLFREGSADEQRIKLNVGTGVGESWNDGGVIDVSADDWVHVAFTISQTESKIYFNGIEMNSSTLEAPIDWTGVGPLTIGAGGDTFDYWGHASDNSDFDELRIFNKALTQADIQIMLNSFNPYIPLFDGESFYMPFNGSYLNLVGSTAASEVGSPRFTDDSYEGSGAYLGATDAYLTHPVGELLTNQFSGAFWYKVDSNPDRSGILVIGKDENRNQGIRLFREGNAEEQRIKLNVGTGAGESWNDGGVIDATIGEWVHVAFTISNTQSKIYLNGVEVNSSDLGGSIDWTDCENITIAAGGDTFSYWGHLSDNSQIDELRFFNKALSTEEVGAVFGGDIIPPFFSATLYMPFDGNNVDGVTNSAASNVGAPGFAGESQVGSDSYAGATDSYLTFPIDNLFENQFSGAFWYKVNADPDRAGILTVAPPMNGADNDLSSGFRLFREGSGTEQTIKLHLGTDAGDVWNNGEVIDVTAGEWVHIAFTVSETATQIYFNGVAVANSGDMTDKTISWANCTDISIGSGAPGFIGWNHLSDSSMIDELYLFDYAITVEEIQAIIAE